MGRRTERWPLPLVIGGWLFLVITLLGLLVGTLNLLNPAAVHIPFGPNGESAEGLDGVIASVASSAVLGLVIGVPAALISWLVLGSGGSSKERAAAREGEMQEKERTQS